MAKKAKKPQKSVAKPPKAIARAKPAPRAKPVPRAAPKAKPPVARAKSPAPKAVPKAKPVAAHAKATKAKVPPSGLPKDKEALAARMAAFSEKVQEEEEAPVAVRSWSEAKADKPASKSLLPKTGQVSPVEDEDETEEDSDLSVSDEVDATPAKRQDTAEEDEDSEDEEEKEEAPAGKPQMNPLTGHLAVPRDRELEFDVAPRHKIKKAGKGGEKPEEFGPVELRQATASGGRHITRALPENLQRGAGRIQPLATPPEKTGAKKRGDQEKFEVSMDKRAGPKLTDLHDWGDVEIGQQTLSGSRKVGRLTPEQEEEQRRAEDDRKRAKK